MTLPVLATVDGQPIFIGSMEEAVKAAEEALAERCGFTFLTLNLDHLVKRRQDKTFREAYARATFVSADGWPVVALARRQTPTIELTTGADLVVPLCRMAARRGIPITLFGSTDAVLANTAAKLGGLCPGLDVRGWEAPPFGFEADSEVAQQAARRIASRGAGLCFVALGAPKQEIFADAARAVCPHVGFVCIGAALDFIAGTQRRAPRLVRSLRMEWAWRFAHQPARLGSRYLRCGVLFLRLASGVRA